jgi:peptide/nickel transport system permease protein
MSKAERAQSLAQLKAHVAETRASPTSAHSTGFSAMLRHARYILGENGVTGFAFALFLLIMLAALLGPYLVPYDPLASDTAAALKAPSTAHWFGTHEPKAQQESKQSRHSY